MNHRRWIIAVVAVLLLAEGGARVLEGHISEVDERGHPELEHKWARVKALASGPDRPSAVAYGNSMMDGAFIPSVFAAAGGERAYNAGFLNAPLGALDRWAEMVDGRLDPDTVILMVNPLDTVHGDVSFGETGGTLAASFDDALDRLEPGRIDRAGRRLEDYSALMRNRSTLRQPAELWQVIQDTVGGEPKPAPQRIDEAAELHEIDWDTVLDDGGWLNRFQDGRLPAEASFPLSFVGALTHDAFDPEPLRRVLDSVSDTPRVVVVIPPIATAVLDRSGIPAEFLTARSAEVAAVARDQGAQVVDLLGAGYPTSLFHDPVHLNREGAERFSRDLAAALER